MSMMECLEQKHLGYGSYKILIAIKDHQSCYQELSTKCIVLISNKYWETDLCLLYENHSVPIIERLHLPWKLGAVLMYGICVMTVSCLLLLSYLAATPTLLLAQYPLHGLFSRTRNGGWTHSRHNSTYAEYFCWFPGTLSRVTVAGATIWRICQSFFRHYTSKLLVEDPHARRRPPDCTSLSQGHWKGHFPHTLLCARGRLPAGMASALSKD